MKTKTQLKSMMKRGFVDDVYKECRLYGEIKRKIDFEYTYTVNFKTNEQKTDLVTEIQIEHKGLQWTFELVEGVCKSIAC